MVNVYLDRRACERPVRLGRPGLLLAEAEELVLADNAQSHLPVGGPGAGGERDISMCVHTYK